MATIVQRLLRTPGVRQLLNLSAFEALSLAEPIAWFLPTAPIFVFTLRQAPKLRWWLLPINVFPAVQCYRTVDQLSTHLPGLDWLLAFTTLIYIIHSTSALYIERWTLPARPPGASPRWETTMAFKAWMNPRRLPLVDPTSSKATWTQRLIFALWRLVPLIVLGFIYVAVELSLLLFLTPMPRDFGPPQQRYFHLGWGRATVLRAAFSLHWAWLTYLILTAAHAALAILFVAVLQLDEPREWPLLYGNPLNAYSIRRFWGSFWHRLGTESQLRYGRLVSREVLGLQPRGASEKTFLAFWVFTISGVVHALVTHKAEPEAGPLSDMWFLQLNFAGGLLELVLYRFGGRSRGRRVLQRGLGYLWLLLFFYCIVPPYQYPVLHKAAVRRMPFKVNMKMSPRSS